MRKLYSVWYGDDPSTVLTAYEDDGEAMEAFRRLILSVRDDIDQGILEPGIDDNMSLYVHAFYVDGGLVRGLVYPKRIMSSVDVQPESDGECEVIED